MKYIYRLYQLVICLPILIVASILTSLTTVIGCMLGNGHFWGYYPGKLWSQLWIRILFLPVKVEGREHLKKGQSYVFVAIIRAPSTSSSSMASWAVTSSG